MPAMGQAYTDLLADRTSLLFQMQSYAASADPEIQARVRERYADLVRQVAGAMGAEPVQLWEFFSTGMLLNVIAALNLEVLAPSEEWARLLGLSGRRCWRTRKQPRPRLTMLDRLAVLIYRRRRRVLWGSLVVVLAAGFFGGPVFGLLDSGDDFDDPQAEAVLAARDIERATGAGASPDVIALVRLGAPADSAQAQEKLARVARAFDDRGVAGVGALRARRRPHAGVEGRPLVLRGGDVPLRRRRRARPRSGPPGAHPGSDRGRRRARRRADRRSGLRGHRARRAAQFPILFLLSFFVFRSLVAALLPLVVGGETIMLSFLGMRFVNGAIEPMSIFALNLSPASGSGSRSTTRCSWSRASARSSSAGSTPPPRCAGRWSRRRTVLFSSITVAAALAALLVFPLRFLYSMGSRLICARAALVSLTVLPAILAALGPR